MTRIKGKEERHNNCEAQAAKTGERTYLSIVVDSTKVKMILNIIYPVKFC